MDTDLTDTNSDFCYITIQHIKEIVNLSDDAVNHVCIRWKNKLKLVAPPSDSTYSSGGGEERPEGGVIELGAGLAEMVFAWHESFDVEVCILTGEVVPFCVTEPGSKSRKSPEVSN